MLENCNELISVYEMQKILGIGKNTAYNLLKQNKINCFRIGRIWKIPKQNLEKYILSQTNIRVETK